MKKAAKEAGAADQDQRICASRRTGSRHWFDVGRRLGGFHPEAGGDQRTDTNGNTGVVLSVTERQEPTPQEYEAKKDQIRDRLSRTAAGNVRSVSSPICGPRWKRPERSRSTGRDEKPDPRAGRPGTGRVNTDAQNSRLLVALVHNDVISPRHRYPATPDFVSSRGGIGDLGPAAYEFIDFLPSARQGFGRCSCWALRQRELSLFFDLGICGNPLLISLERLADMAG